MTSFLDSGRKLKCSGEVNSPSAKVLLRKRLYGAKAPIFWLQRAEGRTGRERSEKTPQWGVWCPLCVSRHGSAASEPRRPLQKRGHNLSCDLFFGAGDEARSQHCRAATRTAGTKRPTGAFSRFARALFAPLPAGAKKSALLRRTSVCAAKPWRRANSLRPSILISCRNPKKRSQLTL